MTHSECTVSLVILERVLRSNSETQWGVNSTKDLILVVPCRGEDVERIDVVELSDLDEMTRVAQDPAARVWPGHLLFL